MRIDFDSYKEITETLGRNKARTFLTGFGVFWGVFMLLGLIGGGKGLNDYLTRNFEGFASNSAIIWAQSTTKPYAGFRKGRNWQMKYEDVERLKEQVPELETVTPIISRWQINAVFSDKKFTGTLKGLFPDYQKVESPKLFYGRYLNDLDFQQNRKVCVIGKKVYKTLFPSGGNPCGKVIKVDNNYFRVVGVDYSEGNININGTAQEAIIIPFTVMQQMYNYGNKVDLICVTGRRGITMSSISQKMRSVVAQAHYVDPTDEKAVSILNTEVMFGMVDSLFRGVNILIWMVGIGTLLAGAIGVSNIMMITVRERTTEIGIRRAVGATPKMILTQILSESLLLTAIAGLGGILFAIIILQFAELGSTSDGIVGAHFQIGFWTAIGAMALLSLLGLLAGLAPAYRAMTIKPIDAIRDE